MSERVIIGDTCVQEGAAFLALLEPRFAEALAVCGPLPLRLRPSGFVALLDTIVSQQISVAAAAAIWDRLDKAGLTDEQCINQVGDDALRACGLSKPKIRYVRELVKAEINYDQLSDQSGADVIKILTAVTGIGPWSAQIYVMFSLGRADMFAPGDLALQEAAKVLFQLEQRPSPKVMTEMAQLWSPWQSVAARILWSYYRIIKNREGMR